MVNNYLTILEESLDKKKEVLQQIQDISMKQAELLKNSELDLQKFDEYVDVKDGFIKVLADLDEGFESLFQKIKQELSANREQYAVQIKCLQDKISAVTDLSVTIQAMESRNRDMVAAYFEKERNSLGSGRKSSKVAYGYYKNLKTAALEESRVFDLKK